jgi:hypothetical protein
MSLVVFAICVEGYQFLAHIHCLSGRTLPLSHRSTVGFGAAIAVDALCYLLACICLYRAGAAWTLLLLPLVAHLFYGSLLLFFRAFYSRIHDYRQRSIYADGSFCRAKLVASIGDASAHLVALVLLARLVPAATAIPFAALGLVAYLAVFAPSGTVRLIHAGLTRFRVPASARCVSSAHDAGRPGPLSERFQPGPARDHRIDAVRGALRRRQ